jgi:uncharacterized short protein YbdD (DUF466 family)
MRERLQRLIAVVHRIIGAPDYDSYVAHLRAAHPDRAPVDRQTFLRERLESRYNKPGARCC